MKDNVVILARIGFYGLSDERTPAKAWEFETYDEAENKLKSLYSEEISLLAHPGNNKLTPYTMQTSIYDAEVGQFKIVGDDSIVIGVILTSNGNVNIDADYLGVNLGPNPET